MSKMEETMMFKSVGSETSAREILQQVYAALQEKGYDPINQLVGYLMSGDPVYITSHNQARTKIRKLERYELLEELVAYYLQDLK
ncbi:MAG: IreB family regulatory phosphoprotein [Peptococcaceae bacterium]|nr:IreB family regulatory phosphoprotein [Peptococcaceae bacterium]